MPNPTTKQEPMANSENASKMPEEEMIPERNHILEFDAFILQNEGNDNQPMI